MIKIKNKVISIVIMSVVFAIALTGFVVLATAQSAAACDYDLNAGQTVSDCDFDIAEYWIEDDFATSEDVSSKLTCNVYKEPEILGYNEDGIPMVKRCAG